MSRNKEFVKNTMILFIGKFATQFSSFLLLPLFTHYLLTDDYGWVDLLQSYIMLFVPILTLRIDSSLFRFLIDKRNDEYEKKKIISSGMFLTVIISVLIFIICLILQPIIKIKYLFLSIINIVILMLSSVLLQVIRGLGENTVYSISSTIAGGINLVINIFLIICLGFQGDSILIASSIANISVIVYIMKATKIFKYFEYKEITKKQIKELLKYSLPMIPNSLSWWIVNVSDRTIISIFLGSTFNGIYTVACKFSNLLNSIFSIFNISWQETASLHIEDEDRNIFFSSIINKIFYLFASISLILNALIPILYDWIIGESYLNAYNYIPILLYANLWNIMISLLGGIYIALKKTREIAITTSISAIINLLINLVFVRFIGLYAATISTLIAYFSISVYRYIDSKKYIDINISLLKILFYTLIFAVSYFIYYLNNIYLNFVNLVIAMFYFGVINKEIIKSFFVIIQKKLHFKN